MAAMVKVRSIFLSDIHLGTRACQADRLIEFFVVEKALYELRYEMNNRPDWLSIPLHSLLRLFGGEPGQEDAR